MRVLQQHFNFFHQLGIVFFRQAIPQNAEKARESFLQKRLLPVTVFSNFFQQPIS
jgi:hypothetical protein